MRRKVVPGFFLTALLAVVLALGPAIAQAKAGRSASMGSRGSRTYTAPAPPAGGFSQPNLGGAAPIERSITPPPVSQPLPPRPATAPPTAAPSMPPVQPPGFFARHPFVGGLLGGLVGAGIGSMLFGGHFFGEGMGGFLGTMLQIMLVVMLVRFAVNYFRRRGQAMPRPVPVAAPYDAMVRPASTGSSVPPSGNPQRPIQFELAQADLAAFEGLLTGIQTAWTQGDLAQLSRLATPEMVGYFGEQLQEERARGLQNRVERVQLLKGDVNETWQEGARQYATVTMQWAAVDYTVRRDTGAVVEGDPRNPTESTELWTMMRVQGGPWQLSAIQQLQLLN